MKRIVALLTLALSLSMLAEAQNSLPGTGEIYHKNEKGTYRCTLLREYNNTFTNALERQAQFSGPGYWTKYFNYTNTSDNGWFVYRGYNVADVRNLLGNGFYYLDEYLFVKTDYSCVVYRYKGEDSYFNTRVTHAEYTDSFGIGAGGASVGGYTGGYGGSTSTGSSTTGSSTSGRSSSRRPCPSCGGTGKGTPQIRYSPNYTGKDNSVYCSICGYTQPAHTHYTPNCSVCNGTGSVGGY